ncbi:MAG: KEOPS complex kinase/ATPase Bud32 [Candidatus Heimdallarchaeaceae archaeon]
MRQNSFTDIKNHKIGAEAILVEDKWFEFEVIRKIRIPKEYRIKQLDENLRRMRTISEARLLTAAKKIGVPTPYIFEVDLTKTTIVMEKVGGKILKDIINGKEKKIEKLLIIEKLGKLVGLLHNNDIIHGDLTTSNVILKDDELVMIDFGLGKISKAVEDKAVDVLLIKKCFASSHAKLYRELFVKFQEGYLETMKSASTVLRRAMKVEARGRHLKEEQLLTDYLVK